MDGPLAGKTLYLGTRAQGARYYRTSSGYANAAGFNTPFPVRDENIYPRSATIAGPGQYSETEYYTAGVAIEHRIGRSLFLEAAVNRTHRDLLSRNVLGFSGTPSSGLPAARSPNPTVDVFSPNLADRGIPDPWNDPAPASNVIYGAPNERFTPGFVLNGRSHSRNRIDSAAVELHSAFFNLTRGWRATFNISHSENVVAGLGENVSAYLEKHRAEWMTHRALNDNTSTAPGFSQHRRRLQHHRRPRHRPPFNTGTINKWYYHFEPHRYSLSMNFKF